MIAPGWGRRSCEVLGIKLRAGLLGLAALLLVGSYAATTASAQGPFFYHRALQGSGNGVKVSEKEPENVEGTSPVGEKKVVLSGKLLSIAVEIVAASVEVKGNVYNNALQGQTKDLLTYVEPELVKPAASNCVVTIGTNNMVKLFGHQAWKWNGTEAQLHEQPQAEQKPDWIFLPAELQQGAEELPKELTFVTITLSKGSGGTCALAGTFPVKGSSAVAVEPPNVGEWGTAETQKVLPNGQKQHFWNGTKNVGVETKLVLGTEPTELKQQTKVKTLGRQGGAPQELAHFES
jgi:hypothetical protein